MQIWRNRERPSSSNSRSSFFFSFSIIIPFPTSRRRLDNSLPWRFFRESMRHSSEMESVKGDANKKKKGKAHIVNNLYKMVRAAARHTPTNLPSLRISFFFKDLVFFLDIFASPCIRGTKQPMGNEEGFYICKERNARTICMNGSLQAFLLFPMQQKENI